MDILSCSTARGRAGHSCGSDRWIPRRPAHSQEPKAGGIPSGLPLADPLDSSPTANWSGRINGGQPQSLADVLTPAGGTWNADGTILQVPASRGNTFRVSETGGGSSKLAPRRTPRLATMLPQFLPNGRQFLFFAVRADESGEVYVGDLENDEVRRVLSADTPASYGMGTCGSCAAGRCLRNGSIR